MYYVGLTDKARKDVGKLKRSGVSNKAKNLVDIIKYNPYQNPPRYEKLVGNLEGMYSRRINIQHRLVYMVQEGRVTIDGTEYEGIVKILRMWTHYEM